MKYKGFETRQDAEQFQKEHGGLICTATDDTKQDYYYGLIASGLNSEKCPFLVQYED